MNPIAYGAGIGFTAALAGWILGTLIFVLCTNPPRWIETAWETIRDQAAHILPQNWK